MSNDLIQSIIREAAEQRLQYTVRHGGRQVPISPEVQEVSSMEELLTPAEPVNDIITFLNEEATNDIVSEMLEAAGATPPTVVEDSPIPEEIMHEEEVSTTDVTEQVDGAQVETTSTGGVTAEGIDYGSTASQSFEEQEEEQEDDPEQMIPSLSTDAEMRESTSRFSGAEWFKVAEQQVITFAGLGGIGSWAAFLLARIHPQEMYLYDPDSVEMVNLSGQLYGVGDVFNNKVSALSSFINERANYYDCICNAEEFTASTPATDVMISGFDNMAARKLYFEAWRAHVETVPEERKKECLFIDARMSAEDIQILCLTGDNIAGRTEYVKNWLFDDEEADAHVCSYKQTSFCAAIIGGLISNLFVNFCTNLSNPVIERPLPFLTTYDASLMFLNVKN